MYCRLDMILNALHCQNASTFFIYPQNLTNRVLATEEQKSIYWQLKLLLDTQKFILEIVC